MTESNRQSRENEQIKYETAKEKPKDAKQFTDKERKAKDALNKHTRGGFE